MGITLDNLLPRAKEHPIFASCEDDEIKRLLIETKARLRKTSSQEIVLHECDQAEWIALVVSGEYEFSYCGADESVRHSVCILSKGDVFGAVLVGLQINHYPGMLFSRSEGELLILRCDELRKRLNRKSFCRFNVNLYCMACQAIYRIWMKMNLFSCYKTADRIRLYLKNELLMNPCKPIVFNYIQLADYLCVNRTALYRVIRKMIRQKELQVIPFGDQLAFKIGCDFNLLKK